ncbi:MAG: hypothetical protein WCH85_01395 [Methanomicrobiales archaeon]
MSTGVCYPDKYAVEETFQLLKVPWEWYIPGCRYDIVISRKADVSEFIGNLLDLDENDFFREISDLINSGRAHLHEPVCDILLDQVRQEIRKYTILVEIPPRPWEHPYMVALTHDVDVTSVKECRFLTVGYAAYQCIRQGNFRAGLHLLCARCEIVNDPWVLFERWKTFEDQLGVRSTFFFVPRKNDPGMQAHPYRAVGYRIDRDIQHGLTRGGWEIGIHGIDNWVDAETGKQEMAEVGGEAVGNRTHWLLFDRNSWKKLDDAGYTYDTTFGYNDDAGFRAGTLQVYHPEGCSKLLELPLNIQDIGLFGNFCWAPVDKGWEKTPCLHLDEDAAHEYCNHIFDYARNYGGAITILWHYENLTPPRDWSGMYSYLVKRALADGAWVTTAGNVVEWFRGRRQVRITCTNENEKLSIHTEGNLPDGSLPQLMLRIHIPDNRHITVNTEYHRLKEYIDIKLNKKIITVSFS